MARPLQSGKKSIDLGAPAPRVSRIRRDPPPKVKEVTVAEIKERDARGIVIGVTSLALALFIILLGFSNIGGSTAAQRTIRIHVSS